MTDSRTSIIMLAFSLLAVLCQAILAPYICIFNAMPNFILAFCIALAVLNPSPGVLTYSFVLGLVYNLMSTGPVGAMAFALVLVVFGILALHQSMGNYDFLFAVIVIGIACLITELIYGVFMMTFMDGVTIVEAIAERGLPCALYDFVLSIVFYVILGFVSGLSRNSKTKNFEYR